MKTYPIKFHPQMIQAIREGRKTQIRQIIEPQPAYVCGHDSEEVWHPNEKELIECPYGQPGDQLLVEPEGLVLEVTSIRPESRDGSPWVWAIEFRLMEDE